MIIVLEVLDPSSYFLVWCVFCSEIIYKKLSATALFKDSHYFIGEKRRAPFPLSGGVKKEKQKFKRSRENSSKKMAGLFFRLSFIVYLKGNTRRGAASKRPSFKKQKTSP